MTKNRFEEVAEPQPDAITLVLAKVEDRDTGRVHCPAHVADGKLAQDMISEEFPAKDAFRSAIKLANEIKAPVVVLDPDKLWQADWGTLYGAEDSEETESVAPSSH